MKSVVKIKLDPSKHIEGYRARNAQQTRRAALRLTIEERGYVPLIRRLNVLYIYNKNRHPELASVFKSDMQYVQRLRQRCLKKFYSFLDVTKGKTTKSIK